MTDELGVSDLVRDLRELWERYSPTQITVVMDLPARDPLLVIISETGAIHFEDHLGRRVRALDALS